MALVYICPNCETKYKAFIGVREIKYENNGAKYTLDADDKVCHACEEEANTEAEKARREALEKRKKK